MLKEYREKVLTLAAKPAQIDSWEAMENPKEADRLLTLPPEQLHSKDYAFLLGGGIEGLYYLPFALEHLAHAKPGKRALCQDVIDFVGRHSAQLMQMGIYTDTIKQLLGLFDVWSSVLSVRAPDAAAPQAENAAETPIRGSACLCELLSAMLAAKLPWRSSDLFHYIFTKWSGEPHDPVRSALLLDMLLGAKDPDKLKYEVQSAPEVKKIANDINLCEAHWQISRHVIQKHCPPRYVDTLKRELALS